MPARAIDHDCLVPGCDEPGLNQLGVRCRVAHSGRPPFPNKRRTDALFSVESAGFLCNHHALGGARLLVMFEPDDSNEAALVAASGENTAEERVTPIRQPLSEVA